MQQNFAIGLKNTFTTHLKMKGLWDDYNLKESHFFVKFNPPSQFYELREQQIFELKSNNFTQMSTHPKIADSVSQKKYLKWSDSEIAENRSWLRKDAAFTFEISQIEALGPNWREQMEAQAEAIGGAPPGGGGMGMPGAGSAIPEFGGAAETPETGSEDPANPIPMSDTQTSLPGST